MSPSLTPTPTPTTTPTPRRYVLSSHIFLRHTFYFFYLPNQSSLSHFSKKKSHLYHRIYISFTHLTSLSLSHRHTTRIFSFFSISNTASSLYWTCSRLYLTFIFPSFQTSHILPFYFLPTSHLSLNKIFLYISLEKNSTNSSHIFILSVNFENLTVEFYIPYIFNMHIKFRLNWILFIIWSINLFFIYNFEITKT